MHMTSSFKLKSAYQIQSYILTLDLKFEQPINSMMVMIEYKWCITWQFSWLTNVNLIPR